MGTSLNRAGAPELLHYRPWNGPLRPPAASIWPIARTALGTIFRRRLFWGLYGLGMMIFLLYFFGLYLLVWLESQAGETEVHAGLLGRVNVAAAVRLLRGRAHLDGSAYTYSNFFFYQGYTVMMVLALAGAVVVGNDLRFGSLPYYLSKPLARWHYLLGKGLAVAVFINLMTTLPALILFVQFGLFGSLEAASAEGDLSAVLAILAYGALVTGSLAVVLLTRPGWVQRGAATVPVLVALVAFLRWDYVQENSTLLLGILAYGVVVTVSLTLVLLATATWLQRTVPLIMTWTALFVFCRRLSSGLVDRLHFNPNWRLIDLWNNTYLVGAACLGLPPQAGEPAADLAALVLLVVSLLCLIYLVRRIRGVEIVR